MNPPTEDIKDILVGQGFGTFQTNMFIGEFPSSPDYCVIISLSTGSNPGLSLDSADEWERPGIQVLVRGGATGYNTANVNMYNIAKYLHRHAETINGARYAYIEQMGDVIYIGKDESNRPIFSANFRIQRTSE